MKYPMIKWAKDLFPICRSITGNGQRKTMKYFKKINPEFKTIKFKTGKRIYDWQIPKEWNIEDAYIQHESGRKFAEFKKNNLHIVGYSTPIDKVMSKKELLKYIYTQKDQPSAVPYVTSYYKKRWGFCMSENEKKKLLQGKYKVFIKSTLKKGTLDIYQASFKGKSQKEIFFSSYICHPSMANNELSGPVLLNALIKYLKDFYPNNRKFSYRFVLLPETIGSIAYLSKFRKEMKKNIICGFNLTCVGDNRNYSYISSRSGNNLADQLLQHALKGLKNVKKYTFLDRGSDERQYCAPGIDLPVCGFSRSKEYKEYHTDKDNFDVVSQKGLEGSFKVMKKIIDNFEKNIYPKNNILCEPNLGKRNLYPTLSQKGIYKDIKLRMDLLAFSDGDTSLKEIALKINQPYKQVLSEYKLLRSKKILD